jgi:hypothetical protein
MTGIDYRADAKGRDSQIRTNDKPAGVGSETSVFQQVKGFLSEAFEAPPAAGYPGTCCTVLQMPTRFWRVLHCTRREGQS